MIKISGEKIKEKRENIGMTRIELSRQAKIPIRTLEDWESGERNARNTNQIIILEKILGCTLSDCDNFGEEIKKIREKKEMTRVEFSTLTGIPKSTLAGWELGIRKPVQTKNIENLLKVLECSLDDLMEEDKDV